MFDFIAIIFWVVMLTCICTLIVAFRMEIAVVIKRTAYFLGLMPYWKSFMSIFVNPDDEEN